MGKSVLDKKTITREQLQELARVSRDPFLFSKHIKVVHPVRGTIPFNLYPYQESCLYQFLKHRFNIVLKFRQGGLTELISMFCLWLAMYHDHKKINIISIKDTTAKKVLKKIKFMYKNLPWYLQTPIINGRMGDFGSVNSMEFSNGSLIESLPTSENAGRSESLSLLVIDEAAAVRWAGQVFASALPTVSTGGSVILNSCVTGDTEIVTKNGLLKIGTVCPKERGIQDISSLNIEVLTHKLQWKRVLASVNKGKLTTWKIKTSKGTELKCTPAHKLLTTWGWKSVEEILSKNLNVIEYDLGIDKLDKPTETIPPKKVMYKPIRGYPNYIISNLGKIYTKNYGGKWVEKKGRPNLQGYLRIKLWNKCNKKTFNIHRLVAEHFIGPIPEGYVIDHLNTNKQDNYVTNLEIVTIAENTKRATKVSYNRVIGSKVNKIRNLQVVGIIKEIYPKVKHLKKSGSNGNGYQRLIIEEVYKRTGIAIEGKYISQVITKKTKGLTLSTLSLLDTFKANIYDISVEDDQSYFVNPSLPSHNTPLGTNNFYHKTWVDAVQGVNVFNPIRLYWQMHPERDQEWYDTMFKALGPKRTAQEIDGDFLSSGNTVFDMSDILAIEQCLTDWTTVRTLLKGQYRQFNEVDPNKEYFIGADCATGRGTDYSAFSVMDRDGEDQACFKGRIPLNKYARLLGDIGEHFNFAKLAPETNDIGAAVTMQLQDEGYPNLYQYQKLIRKKGTTKPDIEEVPGWLTTSKNRSVIIESLEKDIREDEVVIKDPFFTNEAHTFIYDATGRPVAMGKHRLKSNDDIGFDDETYSDDSIFGKAITNHIRKQYGNTSVVLPQ